MKTMSRLWNEDVGAIISAEIMLVASILVIGMVVGLTSLRDSVVTELADVGQALAQVNQSYSFGTIQGHHSYSNGGAFVDLEDFCDTAVNPGTNTGNSKCVVICTVPTPLETAAP